MLILMTLCLLFLLCSPHSQPFFISSLLGEANKFALGEDMAAFSPQSPSWPFPGNTAAAIFACCGPC